MGNVVSSLRISQLVARLVLAGKKKDHVFKRKRNLVVEREEMDKMGRIKLALLATPTEKQNRRKCHEVVDSQ